MRTLDAADEAERRVDLGLPQRSDVGGRAHGRLRRTERRPTISSARSGRIRRCRCGRVVHAAGPATQRRPLFAGPGTFGSHTIRDQAVLEAGKG